jgi:hypothetical protein
MKIGITASVGEGSRRPRRAPSSHVLRHLLDGSMGMMRATTKIELYGSYWILGVAYKIALLIVCKMLFVKTGGWRHFLDCSGM